MQLHLERSHLSDEQVAKPDVARKRDASGQWPDRCHNATFGENPFFQCCGVYPGFSLGTRIIIEHGANSSLTTFCCAIFFTHSCHILRTPYFFSILGFLQSDLDDMHYSFDKDSLMKLLVCNFVYVHRILCFLIELV